MSSRPPIVRKTLTLLREISASYGIDKATEVWNAMSDSLGDHDVTVAVLEALLSGNVYSSKFVVTHWKDNVNGPYGLKVPAIKMLRAWTRIGLKEARDVTVAAEKGTHSQLSISQIYDHNGIACDTDYDKFEKEMASVGFTIELE